MSASGFVRAITLLGVRERMGCVTSPVPPVEPGGGTAVAERPAEVGVEAGEWSCIVWDDPVNLMSFVTHVFSTYFGYPRDKAERLMLQVHEEGRSAVAREAWESVSGALRRATSTPFR